MAKHRGGRALFRASPHDAHNLPGPREKNFKGELGAKKSSSRSINLTIPGVNRKPIHNA